MSVAEIAPHSGGEFERTPPHDIAAEQCVLGGMLLSKDAISDVLEVIKGSDYYRPAHQIIHEVILDLYGRGEPADPVTVSAELTKHGDIGRMGGAPYLHTLIASVPTAANAGYYARIVRERAILRRLVEVGTRIVQLGYSGDGDADELVDRAEAEVYGVTDRRVAEDYARLSEIMPGALDEIEAIGSRGGTLTGVPTGFADLDALTNGLHPGQMIVIAARPAIGKALALDTALPTPSGWTTMGEVRPGDLLLAGDGRPARVVAATEVMTGRPCFEVEFGDGSVIVADAGHQWVTSQGIITTAELAAVQGVRGHAVDAARPAQLPGRDLAVPPYALGVLLGDETGRMFSGAEPELALALESEGVPDQAAARRVLADLGLTDDRYLPAGYIRSSETQRRALLAGLLDVAGRARGNGEVQFSARSHRLAGDVRELVLSLGYVATLTPQPRTGGAAARHVVAFVPGDKVFRLASKIAQQDLSAPPVTRRLITGIRPVASVPVRCVQVDSPDHTYLAGSAWIPTHNSTLALDLARAASVHSGLAAVIFSLEMSRNEITMRLLSAEARVSLQHMRTGQLSDDDWTRLARRMSEVADAPLFIDDSPNMSMMEIRAKCRRLKQRNELKLVIIDYLQLMSSPRRVENRQQEVSDLSRSLKLLAKELDVPVVALSQLNRGPEQRTDKRPMLSDLRESGCLTADTTLLRADTGAPVTMQELLDNGHDGVTVWSLDDQRRIVAAPITNVFPSGVKEVYRLKLASGREVKASGNHPFLTTAGWRSVDELRPGDPIAVPRYIPEPISAGLGWTESRLGRLAHLIGDGGETRIPDVLYSASNSEIAVFLRHLRAADGPIWDADGKSVPQAYYATTSRQLADGVALLLGRLGIVARIRQVEKAGDRPSYHVIVADAPSPRSFCRDDLDSPLREEAATSDVYWDRIQDIESLGPRPVYDATVKGTHNFIADGIFAHNSIEQDSDMVILLHREDAYERESPRAGEADFIVAKHRNGPTTTVTVAFQGHYSRFVDMAM